MASEETKNGDNIPTSTSPRQGYENIESDSTQNEMDKSACIVDNVTGHEAIIVHNPMLQPCPSGFQDYHIYRTGDSAQPEPVSDFPYLGLKIQGRINRDQIKVKLRVRNVDLLVNVEEVIARKKRRHIDQGPSDIEVGELGQGEGEALPFVKIEPEEYGDISDFEVSELDMLAMDMQGKSESQKMNPEEEFVKKGDEHGIKHNEGFWEDFFNEDIEEEILGREGEQEESVDVLVEQLGFLGSNPK